MERITTPPPLPERPKEGHKGLFGRVLVVGGNDGMIGAPVLAATSARRSGGGGGAEGRAGGGAPPRARRRGERRPDRPTRPGGDLRATHGGGARADRGAAVDPG